MKNPKPMHGTSKPTGCSHLRLGSFCKLFPTLDSWAEDCGITRQCDAEEIMARLGGAGGPMHDAANESRDSKLPAAYTFFAQFVDHDITLDTTTKLHGDALGSESIKKLPNLRSASLDLDCVYGFGPEASPHLFDPDNAGFMLTGSDVNGVENPQDIPRTAQGRALIGDPRNDENIFISQLQLLFLKLHNRLMIGRGFEEAQRLCRYHYQWVVLKDFLWRICDKKVYNFAVPKIEDNARKEPADRDYPFMDIRDHCGRLCMPVEFSVAAYRFGHTLVRSNYPVNEHYLSVELFDESFGTLGFSPVPPELVVDWRYLLDIEPYHPFAASKAFDELLADELIRLPNPVVGDTAPEMDRSLAFRNLLRGFVLSLPSGQKVAKALKDKGYPVNPGQKLNIDEIPGWECTTAGLDCDLTKHTPLFFYLMREAGEIGCGERLGPVASAILMEVFGSIFVNCSTTFLHHKDENGNPVAWKPLDDITQGGELTLAKLAAYVG